jgi:hypothetical protein
MKKYLDYVILVVLLALPVNYIVFQQHNLLGPTFYILSLITLPLVILRFKFFLIDLLKNGALAFLIAILLDLALLVFVNLEVLVNFAKYSNNIWAHIPWAANIFILLYNLPNIIGSISLLNKLEEYKTMYEQIKQTARFSFLYVLGIFYGNLLKNLFILHISHLVLEKLPQQKKKYNNMKIENMVTGIKSQMPINRSQEKEMRKIIQTQLNSTKLKDFQDIYFNLFSPNLDFHVMRKLNRILESRAKQQMFRMQRGGMKGMKMKIRR